MLFFVARHFYSADPEQLMALCMIVTLPDYNVNRNMFLLALQWQADASGLYNSTATGTDTFIKTKCFLSVKALSLYD